MSINCESPLSGSPTLTNPTGGRHFGRIQDGNQQHLTTTSQLTQCFRPAVIGNQNKLPQCHHPQRGARGLLDGQDQNQCRSITLARQSSEAKRSKWLAPTPQRNSGPNLLIKSQRARPITTASRGSGQCNHNMVRRFEFWHAIPCKRLTGTVVKQIKRRSSRSSWKTFVESSAGGDIPINKPDFITKGV